MKKCLLYILLSLITGSLWAQRARYKPQTFEIGLQVGMADFIPGLQLNYQSLPTLAVANGLAVSYHLSLENAVRVKAMRYRQDWLDDRLEDNGIAFGLGRQTTWRAQLGYYRKFHTGPLQLYVGGDLIFATQQYTNLSTATSGFFDSEFLTMGIAPEAGVKLFFSPYLSAGAEIQAQLRLLDTRDNNAQENRINPYYATSPPNILGLNANVSLNFHFVPLKKKCTCPRFK
ncbi:MAG: hypothetical protein AAFV07_06280 [Bacteroidota bacterium]